MQPKREESNICILSGLEIPQGKFSVEHYLPRAVCPEYIYNLPNNLFPAIKIYNQVKGHLFPCVWYERRYNLCYRALSWNIKKSDRLLLLIGLEDGLPEYDPCEICVAKKHNEWCKKSVEKMR